MIYRAENELWFMDAFEQRPQWNNEDQWVSPPAGVKLSDELAYITTKSTMSNKTLKQMYPFDFDGNGMIKATRTPEDPAPLIRAHGLPLIAPIAVARDTVALTGRQHALLGAALQDKNDKSISVKCAPAWTTTTMRSVPWLCLKVGGPRTTRLLSPRAVARARSSAIHSIRYVGDLGLWANFKSDVSQTFNTTQWSQLPILPLLSNNPLTNEHSHPRCELVN
ncbi:hypothetical protein ACN42_g2207 [Penicillium freii]|uniref:Uncharacterized protein n=1 Tax=Penicillium freii TaxID=48697 RepID=A0A101MQI6_PENFR|nr:hypothetical protein ACN42_g2207 [Penicillium freii]